MTAGGVKVIDLSGSMSVITTISIGTSPKEIAVSQDGNTLIVANQGDSTISVINTNTNTVASTLSVGASPWGVQISPDSLRAYVGSSTGGVITQIDVANRTVLGNPVDDLAPSSWRGMDMSADGSKLYAAWYDNTSSGKVHVIQ